MRENDIRTLPDGSHFNFKGFEWIALDNDIDGGVLAIMTSAWHGKDYCFDEGCCNNYKQASLRDKLRDELLPMLGEDNLIPHEINLVADNGDTFYGRIMDRVFILNCDEYRKYRVNVPIVFGYMWTCTPWYIPDAGDNGDVRCVDNDGRLYSKYANDHGKVLPACVFNPEKVKVEHRIPSVKEKTE